MYAFVMTQYIHKGKLKDTFMRQALWIE